MTAIPTIYNGIQMRSRLEATWAAVMDHYGIEWLYEPEAFKLSDGTMYLPDFYLPRANMIFEVKGLMTDVDMHKIEQWMRDTQRPAAIGYPDGKFSACDFGFTPSGKVNPDEPEIWDFDENPHIILCSECGCVSFISIGCMAWRCPCCGITSGDGWQVFLTHDTVGGALNEDFGIIPDFETFRPHYENRNWRQRT